MVNNNRYRAKVNGLYVRNASTFSNDFSLAEKEYSTPKYLTEDEKNLVLKYFPNAEIKTYSLVESNNF